MPHYLPGPAVIGSEVGQAWAFPNVGSILLEFDLALGYMWILPLHSI